MEQATATSPAGRVPDRAGARAVPAARAGGQRRPGRLPRQRRQLGAGARLDRGGRRLRAPPPLQRPPRLAHPLGRGDRRLRGRPRHRRPPHRRRRPPRGRLRPQRDRGAEPRRRAWGDANVGAGDRIVLTEMEHHSNIVPWQQLAERVGAEIDWAPIDDDGVSTWTRCAGCSSAARSSSPIAHVSNVLGHREPARRDLRDGARRGRARRRRRRPGGAEAAARHGRARRRLLRDHRPQALRADRHRGALGQARPAAGDAAVPRRRLDDPQGDPRGHHLRRRARPLRGWYPGDRPGDRDGRGDRVARHRLGMDAVRDHEHAIADYALAAPRRGPRPAVFGPPAAPSASAPSPSRSTASTPTTSPRSSTATASPSAPATTARSP